MNDIDYLSESEVAAMSKSCKDKILQDFLNKLNLWKIENPDGKFLNNGLGNWN